MRPCRRGFRASLTGLALLLTLVMAGPRLRAQSVSAILPDGTWSTPRGWSVFTEYSPDSSHILLGIVNQRTFFTVGGAWNQRLSTHRGWQLFYAPEVRPLMVESDPVQTGFAYDACAPTAAGQPCTPLSGSFRFPHKLPVVNTALRSEDYGGVILGQSYYQNFTFAYARRWTYVGALSPVGFRASFLPRARLQPILEANAGFAVSNRDIPMFDTSAFNFTFSFGGGFQLWRTPTRATQIEYRFQHLSNADIGYNDPGIDSQMIHVSYLWGRR